MLDVSLVVNIVAAIAAILAVVTALYIHWDSSSPDVLVYLESDVDHGCTSLVIMNFGRKPAYDIEMTNFDYTFVQSELLAKAKTSFIAKGIPMLAPNQQRKTIIVENRYASNHFFDTCVQGKITFKKKSFIGKRKIQSSYTLDYYSFANSLYVDSDIHQAKNALQSIGDSLAEISKQIGAK